MEQKVLQLDKSFNRYIKLATACVEKDDLQGALNFLLDAERFFSEPEVFARIADVYADMGLLELSNKYWFKYMHSAPKERVKDAYEELAINYFYLDNVWASGYYFQKKLSTDGFISKENIDKEVLDFFSGEEYKKHAYRIVYPFNKADYTLETKSAKRAIALGAFSEAVKILEKIPTECFTEELSGDYAIALFMNDELDRAEQVCRNSIKAHGESVTAYCNLSTIYGMKKDVDKSEYYYRKALSVSKGEQSEAYKIATCAIERADHEKVRECLEKILSERPYELSMRYFYGVCMMNLGNYQKAVDTFKSALMLDPNDMIVEYYYNYAKSVLTSGEDKEKLLPLKYEKELPKKIASKWSKKIKEVMKNDQKIQPFTKNKENRKILRWGILYGDDTVMRASMFILSYADKKFFFKTAQEILMEHDVGAEVKRLLIYVLIMQGHKARTGVVAGTLYSCFSPKKLLSEKDCSGALFVSAYALCVARMLFFDLDSVDKIAKSADKVYLKLKDTVSEADATNEELAALMLSDCNFERYSGDKDVVKIFEISDRKLKKLKEMLNRS